jgi:hypothetical protein
VSARIVFNAPQSRVMRAVKPGRTVTLAFGRGVGKSWFVRRLCYLLVSQWEHKERWTPDGPMRGIRIVFLLPTFKQFKDVHSRAMLNELSGAFAMLGAKVDGTTYTVTFPGGSSIQVFPASEHGGQRARGIRADVVLLDEADDIDGSVFDGVVTPWFTEPWSLKIKIASGTPKRGRHGLLFKLFEAGRRGAKLRSGSFPEETATLSEAERDALCSFYAIHATYRDAPENVDQRTVEAARFTMPASTFAREYECDFDAGEGLVYPFDEAHHVREPPPLPTFREFIVGMDHGWVDAGVLLLIGIQGHGEDATAWALEEWYETECPNNVWDERAAAWNFATFWPDPSRPDRIATLRGMGLDCRELPSDVKPILSGISRVAEMMFIRTTETGERWSRLYVAPACKNLIRELGLYRRKKLPDGTFDEQPEDKNNHACDAIRYGLSGRFGRPVNYRHTASGR